MALKGAESKNIITKKILDTFEGSFQYEKEIRIPLIENGELIQLKCVLTCAKTNVEPNGDVAIPGAVSNEINFENNVSSASAEIITPTQEEKNNIARLAKLLDL